MERLFVDYAQARRLKEAGFDLPCFRYYYIGDTGTNQDHDIESTPSKAKNHNEDSLCVSRPLRSQVLQWFRDDRQLYGSVETDCTTYPKFCYSAKEFFGNPIDLTEREWGWKDVGLCLYLYRDYSEAEKELIDYLISKIEP